MLELKDVSKFYYKKGMVTSGFNKVSLKFELGEFVAITGESGSGKTTLLNVISGLDSYQEGEMYINGEETSYYTEKDYEKYRKKYIGNIFQNFNLVNSYTVYQNIELVLLLNGKKKKDIKNDIIELIKKVDLYKYRNTRVSKLSGGQKQRVAIARVLALNTPIILADEPTGNLDKKSSESVLKLLHEVSKDKLVIVVTHNYEQIEQYVTRKITMHDGKVLEDKRINKFDKLNTVIDNKHSDIKWYNKLRLGIRNAFNIPSKFILILVVYLFILLSVFSSVSSFKSSRYDDSLIGYNNFFNNISDKRIIIKKKDHSEISEDDYNKINKISNVDKIVKNDYLLDYGINITDNNNIFIYGSIDNNKNIIKVDKGRLPNSDNELVIELNKYDYYGSDDVDLFNKKLYINELNDSNVKIVGIIYRDDYQYKIYVSDKIESELNVLVNKTTNIVTYSFYDLKNRSEIESIYNELLPSKNVKKGNIVISEDLNYLCKDFKCNNKTLKVNVNNIYYDYNYSYKVSNSYNKKNIEDLTGYKYDKYNGALFMNIDDYNSLYNNGYYQSSVFVKNAKIVRETIDELENNGYKTLYVIDVLNRGNEEILSIINIFHVVVISILLIVLFFISYFIIKLVLKSRNVYYSILRILGSSVKNTKDLLNIELLTLSNLSFILFMSFILLVSNDIIKFNYYKKLIEFMNINDYIFIYVSIIIMTLLISMRYSRKLFKDTVMNTYKEEV